MQEISPRSSRSLTADRRATAVPVTVLTILSSKFGRYNQSTMAFASRAPFLAPAHPMRGTDCTSWPGKRRESRQFRFSSRRILIGSGRLQEVSARFFEDGDHLLTTYAGKPSEDIVDAIAPLKVIE